MYLRDDTDDEVARVSLLDPELGFDEDGDLRREVDLGFRKASDPGPLTLR